MRAVLYESATLALATLVAVPAVAQTRPAAGYGASADGYRTPPPPSDDEDDAPPPSSGYRQPQSPSDGQDQGDRRTPPSQPDYGEVSEARSAPADQAGDPAADLVRRLNLRSDQQAAFRDYQAAFQSAQDEAPLDDPARLQAMTAPQRLDATAQQMQRDQAGFARIAAATRRFYVSLDPAQRRTFDRLTAPPVQEDGDDDQDGGPPRQSGAPPEGR